MKKKFRMFVRNSVYWCQDNDTGKQESLRTKDRATAERLLHAKNEAEVQPSINLQIARAYLQASDPEVGTRTWQTVMDEMAKLKRGNTLERFRTAIQDSAFNVIRNRAILETRPENFLRVLNDGTVSTNVFLRRIHNFALDMNWLPWPILPKPRWPVPSYKAKRAITAEEHQAILSRESNSEWKAYFAFLWETGGAQTDIASLRAEDIDWESGVLSYRRKKTGTPCFLTIGEALRKLLSQRPEKGPIFPNVAKLHEKHRANQFRRRYLELGIKGISLHSYRYAWAERARKAGYPERFAQDALGHNSQAVHRAYARKAKVILPTLEGYEIAAANKLISFSSEKPGKPQNSPTIPNRFADPLSAMINSADSRTP